MTEIGQKFYLYWREKNLHGRSQFSSHMNVYLMVWLTPKYFGWRHCLLEFSEICRTWLFEDWGGIVKLW